MKKFLKLVKRNTALFFKDKGLFFTSLITPMILLLLYGTFLGNVFKDSYSSALPKGMTIPSKLLSGLVAGQLAASLLSVSCVTVAFCSNMLVVHDKINGVRRDFLISPVRPHILALSYFSACFLCTLLVCVVAAALCFGYSAIVGWYYSVTDVFLILLDVVFLTLFGSLFSSVVNGFLTSQGQVSAVGTIVSSAYGFICGAYMPIASFGAGLQKVLSCLPTTYATILVKNHTMRGALDAYAAAGAPEKAVESFRKFNDLDFSVFGHRVPIGVTYLIVGGTVVLLLFLFVLLNVFLKRERYSE